MRVYFSCRPPADANGQYVSYSAFVDLDRDGPVPRCVRVADAAHPAARAAWASSTNSAPTRSPSSATATKSAPTTAAGRAANRCRSTSRSAAPISHDEGKTFTKLGNGPVLGRSPDEPFVLSGPKIRRFNGTWYLWYIAGRKWKLVDGPAEPVYKIRMATSRDGIHWTRMNTDLIESRIEEDEAQASPDVFYADGSYHMFFCYRYSSDYPGQGNGYRIGYASSTDLTDWVARRLARRASTSRTAAGTPRWSAIRTCSSWMAGRIWPISATRSAAMASVWPCSMARWRRPVVDEVEKARQDLRPDAPRPAERLRRSSRKSPQALVFDDFVRIYFSTRAVDAATASI